MSSVFGERKIEILSMSDVYDVPYMQRTRDYYRAQGYDRDYRYRYQTRFGLLHGKSARLHDVVAGHRWVARRRHASFHTRIL